MTDLPKSTSGITAKRGDVDRVSGSTGSLTSRVKAEARRLGFDLVGVTDVRGSAHAEFYRAWLERGLHGDMGYLEREDAVAKRLRPAQAWPELRSAIVMGMVYGQGDEPSPSPSAGIIARYARGRDYHRVLKAKVMALLRFVEAETGREQPAARAYVDTGPVLERELAQRAGLGWYGRNTMLINPGLGSYFFLAALLLETELEPNAPFAHDRCGTCTRCVDACPTGALLGRDESGAPVMDATRCISYLTIEQRGPIPRELRPLVGNRIYGCDICQEACPWNAPKFVQLTSERDYRADWRAATDRPEAPRDLPGTGSPSLIELMAMTREEWDVWTRGSAIRRAGYAGFKRNVAVAMGNWLASVVDPSEAAVAALRHALEDESDLVREHAAWALRQVDATASG
ncbi:MAG TPA: tRNA epoxyqueuosine(34) reductase QueG [Longimicrobiales bacterium]|nr:tRNA epoxyqueuosine(34) reductase QueG [Longimicrobiales bacterium]